MKLNFDSVEQATKVLEMFKSWLPEMEQDENCMQTDIRVAKLVIDNVEKWIAENKG